MVISWFRSRLGRRSAKLNSNRSRFRPAVQRLEDRDCPAFTAAGLIGKPNIPSANPAPPVHTITGVSLATDEDVIIISKGGYGIVNVLHKRGQFHFEDNTATPDEGTVPQVIANYNLLVRPNLRLDVFAGPGNDIVLNHTDLPCRLLGEEGNDVLYGGGGNDVLYGGINDDVLGGRGGNDYLYGENGDLGTPWQYLGIGCDYLVGGDGSDHLFGEWASDTLIGGYSVLAVADGEVDYLDGNRWLDIATMWWQFLDGFGADKYYVEIAGQGDQILNFDFVFDRPPYLIP
jgi:Ca2+-binding RTX toxin-like protein